MASFLPSLSIVAVDTNGLPQEFSNHRPTRRRSRTPRRRSTASRTRSLTPSSSRHRRRSEMPQKPRVVIVEPEREEELLVTSEVVKEEREEAPPAQEENPPAEEASATAKISPPPPPMPTTSMRRSFLSRKSSSASSGRFSVFKNRKAEKVITHKVKKEEVRPKVPVAVPLVVTRTPSIPSPEEEETPLLPETVIEDEVVYFPEEQDAFFDKTPQVTITSGPTSSIASRSHSNRSYATSTSRRSRRSGGSGSRLIKAPTVLEDTSDDDSCRSNDDETRQDEEIRWLAGRSDRTTISSVGGRSHAGVDSVIADPTEMCALLQDVMYRDFRNFWSNLYPSSGQIGYREMSGMDCAPVVEYTRSDTTEGEFQEDDWIVLLIGTIFERFGRSNYIKKSTSKLAFLNYLCMWHPLETNLWRDAFLAWRSWFVDWV